MQVTLPIDLETWHRFHSAHERLSAQLGVAPSVEWLMGFALARTDAAEVARAAGQLSSDLLRNRVPLE